MKIKTLDISKTNFNKELNEHLKLKIKNSKTIETLVSMILDDIKKNKDKALIKLSRKYDKTVYKNISESVVSKNEIAEAYLHISKQTLASLKKAIMNIKKFSRKQMLKSWSMKINGSTLGERVTAIKKVGIYVPGGKASYPSTVLMNAIPARTAGVKDVTMVCPPINGKLDPLVLTAADLCGVNRIYKIGGAHAIGALAYGTETIQKVHKIVGPGNIYVATAKRKVFGTVGIDNFAGPSEILIIADKIIIKFSTNLF